MVNRRDLIKLGALASTGLVGTAGAEGTATVQTAEDATLVFAALSGAKQVPPVETDATGFALFAVGEKRVDYALAVADIDNVLMAHVHVGGPDENGPVVVWLDPSVDARKPKLRKGTTTGITSSGTFTADDFVGPLEGESLDALVERMLKSEAYVNVHTKQNKGGEIRGQTVTADQAMELGPGQPKGTETEQQKKTVTMVNTSFNPIQANVAPGTTVEWVNEDSFAHTVTAAQFHDNAAEWSFDERVSAGQSVTHTFEEAGVYEYYCTIHGKDTMCGAVLVGDVSLGGSLPCSGVDPYDL